MDTVYNPINDFVAEKRRATQRKIELAHEQELALIRARAHALVWTGTEEGLTATITRWYESGLLAASSQQDALRKASVHFLGPMGQPVIKVAGAPVFDPRPSNASVEEPPAPSLQPQSDSSRNSFVLSRLSTRGWSVLDWSKEAGVAHATAMDYLYGKTRPYRSTRLKLAIALGVDVEQLPS
jgi:lambda repressor-like predicted transcriptional regulator